jgi:hypothetical protein
MVGIALFLEKNRDFSSGFGAVVKAMNDVLVLSRWNGQRWRQWAIEGTLLRKLKRR